MTEPLLVSVPKAGELLGVGPDLVRDLIRDGELPAVHVRRRLLVRVVDLHAYVDRLPPDQDQGEDDHERGFAVVAGGGRRAGRPRPA